MLKDEIEKKNQWKKDKTIPEPTWLIRKTRALSDGSMITPHKANNKKNYDETQFLINSKLKDEVKK